MRIVLVLIWVLGASCLLPAAPSIGVETCVIDVSISGEKPNPVVLKFFKKQNQRKRIIASTLAFPLPFGFLGLHRIYLGTKPYVPLIYVGTLGGCAGILPMIDFCNLVSNKDISRFQANPRIFMWVDNDKKND